MPGTHPELRHERTPGRPTLLNADVQKRLLEAVRLGVPVKTAAEHAGIHPNTFYRWMARGFSEHESIANGQDPLEEEAQFLDLYKLVSEGRAEAAVRNVALIQKAAQGGYVTKEVTKKYRDVETGKVVTQTEVERAGPDWRASAWYLERVHKDEFGKDAVQVQVTGAGGGAVRIDSSVEELSERLGKYLAENAAVAAITAGGDDTIDGEATEEPVDADIVGG